ncbi:MAG: TRAP transporter permease [Clostridiales bacterium]
MAFLDKGSKRDLKGSFIGNLIYYSAAALALYGIYASVFSHPHAIMYRGVFIAALLAMTLLRYTVPNAKTKNIRTIDYILAVLSILIGLYIILNTSRYVFRTPFFDPVTTTDFIFGILAILLVLEATRRAIGYPLTLISVILLFYPFFGKYVPGMFGHRGFTFAKVIEQMFMTTSGIFGESVGIATSYVLMFVVFGEFLNSTGGGDFFFDLSRSIAGSTRGGHAKTAVVASALFGSISGSPISNVATTGAMTIPMMKRSGYPAYFAGAVETAASCGGTIMPPVMGAVAFLMAEIIGVTYTQVLIAAVIPALLYYGAVFFAVDFEAVRQNLKGDSKENKPPVLKILIKGIQYLFPLIWLVARLFMGLSPSRVALEAIVWMIVIALISRNPKYPITVKGLVKSLVGSTYSLMPVALACATAGLVIGVINLTGLGAKFTSLIMALGRGMLFPALLLTMLVTIILGMGMSISPTYLLAASLAAPGLINVGVSPMAAHLFIVYFSAMATMTPPVSLAAYTAAGIADADPIKVGFTAVRIGIVAFVIPFVFIYQPQIILQSTNYIDTVFSVIFTLFGVVALTGGINSWFFRILSYWEIGVMLVACLLMFLPYYLLNIIGLVIFIAITFYLYRTKDKAVALPHHHSQEPPEETAGLAAFEEWENSIVMPASSVDDLTNTGDAS